MIMTFELDDKMHKEISKYAKDRGLTEEEVCRWLIGHAMFNMRPAVPSLQAFMATPFSSTAEDKDEDNLAKVSLNLTKMFMKTEAAKGAFKCSECTQPMTYEDIVKGICGKCHRKI
jgi:hypothetical protein